MSSEWFPMVVVVVVVIMMLSDGRPVSRLVNTRQTLATSLVLAARRISLLAQTCAINREGSGTFSPTFLHPTQTSCRWLAAVVCSPSITTKTSCLPLSRLTGQALLAAVVCSPSITTKMCLDTDSRRSPPAFLPGQFRCRRWQGNKFYRSNSPGKCARVSIEKTRVKIVCLLELREIVQQFEAQGGGLDVGSKAKQVFPGEVVASENELGGEVVWDSAYQKHQIHQVPELSNLKQSSIIGQ